MSKCIETRPVAVCYTDGTTGARETLLAHVIYEDGISIGQAYTTAADTETQFDITGGTVTAGACPVAAPDVEWEQLCDDVNGDGTDIVEFLRRSITSFDASGAVVDPVDVADFELDKVTPYVISAAANVVACNQDCDLIGSVGTITSWADIA